MTFSASDGCFWPLAAFMRLVVKKNYAFSKLNQILISEWKIYMANIFCKKCLFFKWKQGIIVTKTVVKGTVLVLVRQIKPHPSS